MSRGGARPGAGRKKTGRQQVKFYLTLIEKEYLKSCLKEFRCAEVLKHEDFEERLESMGQQKLSISAQEPVRENKNVLQVLSATKEEKIAQNENTGLIEAEKNTTSAQKKSKSCIKKPDFEHLELTAGEWDDIMAFWRQLDPLHRSELAQEVLKSRYINGKRRQYAVLKLALLECVTLDEMKNMLYLVYLLRELQATDIADRLSEARREALDELQGLDYDAKIIMFDRLCKRYYMRTDREVPAKIEELCLYSKVQSKQEKQAPKIDRILSADLHMGTVGVKAGSLYLIDEYIALKNER